LVAFDCRLAIQHRYAQDFRRIPDSLAERVAEQYNTLMDQDIAEHASSSPAGTFT
jgi:hypothetical protein